MINIVSINNSEQTVYTAPTGKNILVFIDINPTSNNPNVKVYINNVEFCNQIAYYGFSLKLSLTEGDSVKVNTNGSINVFVHGIEI